MVKPDIVLPDERLVKVFAHEKHRGTCRRCGAALLWTRTVHHSRMLPFPSSATPVKVGIDARSREPVEFYRLRACHDDSCPAS